MTEAERLGTVLRLAVKQHFGIRAEKLVELKVQPFRGRKKPAPPTTPPVNPTESSLHRGRARCTPPAFLPPSQASRAASFSDKLAAVMSLSQLSPQEYHARREQARREEREALRGEVLEQARAAIRRLAPRFPAIRAVYLFGSVLAPGRFLPDSDVDVALDSDDLEVETPFWRGLEDALQRNVDLRPREGAVARAVEDSGERCYEREVPGP